MENHSAFTKKQAISVLLISVLIIAVCVSFWYVRSEYIEGTVDYKQVQSDGGIWDFTGLDVPKQTVRLRGEVEYIPDVILTPEEFAAREGEAKVGYPEDETNISTSRIRIRVPDGIYAFMQNSIDFNARVYVNGDLRIEAGRPALTEDESQPGAVYMYFEAQPENGVIEIVQQTSNFYHKDSGGHANLFMGTPAVIQWMAGSRASVTSMILGVFVALFLIHLILFIIFRQYKANLYFALFCLIWGLRVGVTGMKLLLSLLPALGWEWAFRLEYISIPAGALFVILMLGELFPVALKKWFVRTVTVVSLVGVVFFLLADTMTMSHSINIFYVVYAVVGLFTVLRVFTGLHRMLREGSFKAVHLLTIIGLLVFLYGAAHDALHHSNVYLFGIRHAMSDMVVLIFALLEMAAMFYGTQQSEKEAWRREQIAHREAQRLRREAQARDALAASIPEDNRITRGPLMLNTLSGQAFLNGEDMLLSPKEFALLSWFIQHEGEPVPSAQLYEKVWQQEPAGNTRTVTTAVSRLRKKLADDSLLIESERGKGYIFRYHPKERA